MAFDNGTQQKTPEQVKPGESPPGKDRPAPDSRLLAQANTPEAGKAKTGAPKEAPKAAEPVKEANVKDIKVEDSMRNAVGAYVLPDKDGNVLLLDRKDKSRLIPTWETGEDGKKTRIASIEEVSAGGKASRIWTREGEDFTCPDRRGGKLTLKNVEFDKSNNGNFSYVRDGRPFTIRGKDSTPIEGGPNNPQFKYDDQGRIKNVIPTLAAWDKGAPSLAFNYVGETENLAAVSELTKENTSVTHVAKDGESVTPTGDYKREYKIIIPAIGADGKPIIGDDGKPKVKGEELKITHTHFAGTVPQLDERTTTFKNADGTNKSTGFFDANNKFIGVQGIGKDGTPLKRFIMPNDKQMLEIDPARGDVTVWNKGQDRIWRGVLAVEKGVNLEKPKSVGERTNFSFNADAVVKYTDAKGSWHTEYKDGKKEIGSVVGNGIYHVKDEKDRLIKSGVVTSQGADLENYLGYKYRDENSPDGKPIITEVSMTYKGKTEQKWSPDKGQEAELLPNGELKYIANDGKEVLLSPDLSESKYQPAKDKQPRLLLEKSFPDRSVRTYKYGDPADPKHPMEIKSKALDTKGDTIIRTFTAKPLEAPEPEKLTTSVPAAADTTPPKPEEPQVAVQLWELTEEKAPSLSKAVKSVMSGNAPDLKAQSLPIQAAPVFDLTLDDNGNFEATSTLSDKTRYLFPARGMTALPRGVAVPLAGADGRVLKAQQKFEALYVQHCLPEERTKMHAQQLINGRLVAKDSFDKDPQLVTMLAHDYMSKGLKIPELKLPADPRTVPAPQLAQMYTDIAYNYELAAAMIEGKLALERAKKAARE